MYVILHLGIQYLLSTYIKLKSTEIELISVATSILATIHNLLLGNEKMRMCRILLQTIRSRAYIIYTSFERQVPCRDHSRERVYIYLCSQSSSLALLKYSCRWRHMQDVGRNDPLRRFAELKTDMGK